MTTATAGTSKIILADEAILRSVDKVSDGAGSSFLDTVRPTLHGIMDSARSRWPVRSGTSRDAFQLLEEVTDKQVKSGIYNPASIGRWGLYAYKVRYSSWTEADLKARVEEAAARGLTPESQAKIRRRMQIQLKALHGAGAPDEASQGKNVWVTLVRVPVRKGLAPLMPQLQAALLRLSRP